AHRREVLSDVSSSYAATRGVGRTSKCGVPRSAPFLVDEPCHDQRTIVPVLNMLLPPPDLRALGGGPLLTRLEEHTKAMSVELPRALPEPREHDGLQCSVGTDMLRPVRVVGDDVADDLRTDLTRREALKRLGRLGVHYCQHEAHGDTGESRQWRRECRGVSP